MFCAVMKHKIDNNVCGTQIATWQNESSRLLHAYFFYQITIKEGVMNIKLPNHPTIRDNEKKNNPNSSWLDDRAKSLIIINPKSL